MPVARNAAAAAEAEQASCQGDEPADRTAGRAQDRATGRPEGRKARRRRQAQTGAAEEGASLASDELVGHQVHAVAERGDERHVSERIPIEGLG